ncbi:MAG: PrsW family intramembrane metalloprotease, partial [Methanomicrobiaceae archaeon]|nr:PrsW family intramembrane metalloprotease [Methanomicrobiaceae archaeon]
ATMSRNVLPAAAALLLLLFAVTGFAAESGMHLQDGMYRIGADDPDVLAIVAPDARFDATIGDAAALRRDRAAYDVVVLRGEVYAADTAKGRSALRALEQDYERYVSRVLSGQEDLYAAYPLWIDLQYVKSELDFDATESGIMVGGLPDPHTLPLPEGPVEEVPPPVAGPDLSMEELRQGLIRDAAGDHPLSRYADVLSPDGGTRSLMVPSRLTPSLPFDSIVLVFVFIFPLYFTSQFFMMSIMNERIGRRGEALLSSPIRPWTIIDGKAAPYFAVMLLIAALITAANGAPQTILLPLFPVILFFLANALIIGMVSRSFKELSFLSIFFSTIATSYLFFPTVFAGVHVVSLVSPLTLVILALQGEGFTLAEYVYSTSLFFATAAVLFYAGVVNFNEERLFGHLPLRSTLVGFVSSGISRARPYCSLFALGGLSVPFVFMAQMMSLVLLFNLPAPLSLVLLLLAAAFIEEFAKSVGIYALFSSRPGFFTPGTMLCASFAVALGFLLAEKILLLATLSQITESIFGSILFLGLHLLWMPLLLHAAGVLLVSAALKAGGPRAYGIGLVAASTVHCLYNIAVISGWIL